MLCLQFVVAVMCLFLFIQEFYDNDSFFLRKLLVSIDCFYKLSLFMTENTLVYLLNTGICTRYSYSNIQHEHHMCE